MDSATHTTRFDPALDLIYVDVQLVGPRGRYVAKLALDTGSVMTVVIPDVLDAIGYSVRDAGTPETARVVMGSPHGFWIRVAELTALGATFLDFPLRIYDLAVGVEGVVGLDVLRHFNYQVRSAEGRILVERITPRRGARR